MLYPRARESIGLMEGATAARHDSVLCCSEPQEKGL